MEATKEEKKKNSFIVGAIRVTGVTGLIGLVTFLSTIFCTNESFSNWKELQYYPDNRVQDERINKVEGIANSTRSILLRIEIKQEKILEVLMNKSKN